MQGGGTLGHQLSTNVKAIAPTALGVNVFDEIGNFSRGIVREGNMTSAVCR